MDKMLHKDALDARAEADLNRRETAVGYFELAEQVLFAASNTHLPRQAFANVVIDAGRAMDFATCGRMIFEKNEIDRASLLRGGSGDHVVRLHDEIPSGPRLAAGILGTLPPSKLYQREDAMIALARAQTVCYALSCGIVDFPMPAADAVHQLNKTMERELRSAYRRAPTLDLTN